MGYIGKVPADVLIDPHVDSAAITDGTIITADIANDAVTSAKLAENSVDSSELIDGSVDNSHLAGSIAVNKTLLTAGTGLTLSTNTLSVDAAQTQITSVGTLTSLTTGAITQNAGTLTIKNAGSDSNGLKIFQDTGDASKIYNHYNGTLQLGVGSTTAITIDSSENTTFAGRITANDEHHYFQNTSGNANVYIKASDSGNSRLYFGDVADVGAGFIDYDHGTSMALGTEGTTALTIDSSQNSTFAGTIISSTSSTTDSVLTLTDAGVADYKFTFPDTSTIKMSTNTSSSKVFELKNEGSGFFSLKVEGEIEIQASSDPAIKFNSSEAGADAWYLYSAGSGLKFRNLDDSVTALELTHSNNALLSGSLYMAGGSTGRILFNSQRAMEGTTNNTLLSLGEDYVDVRVRANCIPDGNNTRNLGSTSARWSVLFTSNSVNVSDRTTKTEIADCDLGTDFINTLQPKSYKMVDLPEEHDDYDRKHYGLIAQDLIDTELNDSVFGEQDGEYSLAYNDLIAPMIKAIQELSAEIEKLKGN